MDPEVAEVHREMQAEFPGSNRAAEFAFDYGRVQRTMVRSDRAARQKHVARLFTRIGKQKIAISRMADAIDGLRAQLDEVVRTNSDVIASNIALREMVARLEALVFAQHAPLARPATSYVRIV